LSEDTILLDMDVVELLGVLHAAGKDGLPEARIPARIDVLGRRERRIGGYAG